VASPSQKTRGNFKLFLGYAPGVGKTYAMLSEAIRRHSRDEDVVIGLIETHGRKAIEELAAQLEAVPRKKIEYKGTQFEEMDWMVFWRASRQWSWWTNWRTPIFPEARIVNAMRMCRRCWPRTSM